MNKENSEKLDSIIAGLSAYQKQNLLFFLSGYAMAVAGEEEALKKISKYADLSKEKE